MTAFPAMCRAAYGRNWNIKAHPDTLGKHTSALRTKGAYQDLIPVFAVQLPERRLAEIRVFGYVLYFFQKRKTGAGAASRAGREEIVFADPQFRSVFAHLMFRAPHS